MPETSPATTGDKAAILIVDDNPTNLGVLFDYLDDHDFRVLVAQDGESAIEQARFARPDIILLDVMMPGLDGFETCRLLREDQATGDIPVIFMTALTDASDKVKSFRAGAVDYITKPFQHAEVLARVNTHLRIHNLQRALAVQNTRLQQEIVQRLEAEEALKLHVAKLQASNAELDAFARTVAHDLKDPLTMILGFAGILGEEAELAGEYRTYFEAIVRNGNRMNNIIDELLLLARLRDGKVKLHSVRMPQLIERSRERLAHMFEEHDVSLEVASEWPAALGYAPWVEEVWVNYLSNAIKYGGRPPRIMLGASARSDGYVRYWVRDNGAGISDADRGRLFNEFTQLSSIHTKGYGLGLSIVKRIIEKLNGRVGAESDPGQGSLFYFELKTSP